MITQPCSHCQKPVTRFSSAFRKSKSGNVFCDKTCRIQFSNPITKPCANCQKTVTRQNSDLKRNKSGNIFCSSACSAKFNNRVPKRKRSKVCKLCDQLILAHETYCEMCAISSRFLSSLSNKTLCEVIASKKSTNTTNRYTGIRRNARSSYISSGRPMICSVCGYDHHVEICHLKDISSFSLNTFVSEINAYDNLTAFCPNHHWEYDHPSANTVIRKNYISKVENKTLAEVISTYKGSNRYRVIRCNARKLYIASDRPLACEFCGYNRNFEVCHIKDIARFPLDSLVGEINSLDNLIALCPNHHWELDGKFLQWDRLDLHQ